MKKINLNGKLNLNKETVSKLNEPEMDSIKGGYNSVNALSWGKLCTAAVYASCNSHANNCPSETQVTKGIFCR